MLVRLVVVLTVAAVIAAMPAASAMAQSPQEERQAEQLLRQAEAAGIAVPSDPEAIIRLGAQYGVTISPGVAAAVSEAEDKGGNPKAATKDKGGKELPKSGGSSTASLLGLGVGALLVGGGLLARRIVKRLV